MTKMNQPNKESIISKKGKAVSDQTLKQAHSNTLFGLHKKELTSHDDLIEPIDAIWDVEKSCH